MDKKRLLRSPLVWIGVLLVLYLGYSYFADETRGYVAQPTSVALAQLKDGNVTNATIDDKEQRLRLDLTNPVDGATQIYTSYPAASTDEIFNDVQAANISGGYNTTVTSESTLFSLLIYLIPVGLIILFLLWMMNNAQGGGNKVLSFGKSKAKLLTKDMPVTKFTDVAGADEAVQELDEIRDFLANPAKYQALGAKIPKGVLLYGPPGTGKTLLARAVAGEAGVPFYSISGSDFVEMFVGVGASRVRDLFEQAKANSPAIIFVDEIDAVGRHRGAGMGGGHDEREQTLNQLLVEMDGFEAKGGIILIAATNRPDILDPALLRPGRFDRQIPVGQPDLKGRQAILAVHSKGKPFAPDVEFLPLAKRTVGMSGADLANVINEAALLTAREHGTMITNAALEESVDRVVGGPARRGKVISEREKKITAYHEGGHALAAWAMPGLEPVYKVTILPRGRTGGHALVVPEDDKSLMTRSEMIARLVMAMGGRAAEELVFAEPTTGASSDIAQATKIARAMVTEYGMSAKLGAVKYGHGDDEPFLGRTYGSGPEYSIEVGSEIDGEVRALIEAAHTEAWAVLNTYRDILDSLASALLEKETLERRDLEVIFAEVEKRPQDHHLRRVRPAAAVRSTADQDAGRIGHRTRRAVAAAGEGAGPHRGADPGRRRVRLPRAERLQHRARLPDRPTTGHRRAGAPAGASQLDGRRAARSARPDARLAAGPGPAAWAGPATGPERNRARAAIPDPHRLPGRERRPGQPVPPGPAVRPRVRRPTATAPHPAATAATVHTRPMGRTAGPAMATTNGGNGAARRRPGSAPTPGRRRGIRGRDGRAGVTEQLSAVHDACRPGGRCRRPAAVQRRDGERARAEPLRQCPGRGSVRELLIAVGENPDRDGLKSTPGRVARAFAEQFSGLHIDPSTVLNTSFDENHNEMILMRDIELYSTCEHHLLPFFGKAHVGYIPGPDGRVTGLSKLARLVDGYAKRPQVQERLTTQIAEALVRRLQPAGAIVVHRGRAPVHGHARHPQARAPSPPPRRSGASSNRRTGRAPRR